MYHRFNWTNVAEKRNSLLRQYEPLQLFLLYEFAEFLNIDTFIDVGANIGAYSIIISSLECVENVHAFEPSPETVKELAKNVAINVHCKEKITIHNQAVSSASGAASFGIVDDYSGANSILNTSIHSQKKLRKEILVERVTLDDVFRDTSKTFGLKVDVEGHEQEVLIGAKKLLTNNKAIIQLEDYTEGTSNLDDLLHTFGYEKILAIGPDRYFTNVRERLSDGAIVRIVESAAKNLIEANFESQKPAAAETPIKIKLLKGVSLEISGALARVARRAKNVFKGEK